MACGLEILSLSRGPEGSRFWQAGDLVAVYAAIRCGDPPSANSPFWVVVVLDAEVEDLQQFVVPQRTSEVIGQMRPLSRCAWTFSPNQLPARVRNDFNRTRRCEISWDEILGCLFKKDVGFSARVLGVTRKIVPTSGGGRG